MLDLNQVSHCMGRKGLNALFVPGILGTKMCHMSQVRQYLVFGLESGCEAPDLSQVRQYLQVHRMRKAWPESGQAVTWIAVEKCTA